MAYVLPQCTSIERLKFVTDASKGHSMPFIAGVRLPLISLTWQGLWVDDLSIFDPLILPRLTSVDMHEGCGETLFRMHEHSGFALGDIRLTFFQLAIPRLSDLLRAMPSLTDEFLGFLTYDKDKPLLPRLERLVICDGEQHFDAKLMLRMVESRWRTTPLARIRTGSYRRTLQLAARTAHHLTLDRVTELVEEGLVFEYD
ncbi:hypothetical protein C8R47DRAFT_1255433 [Mycena vitilis]|nr:hypothetical protein C8R47DRAFT_1255433 [Mycena vitilis]